MKTKKNLTVLFLIGIFLFLNSCEKDSPQKLEKEESSAVQSANKLLADTVVLSTRASMSGVSKTLLEEGCPTRFTFKWDEKIQKLHVRLPKFQVGTMPFAVVFYCNTTYSELNSWEKEEYPEEGWIKFYGDDGAVVPYVPDGVEKPVADGAGIITGYVNPKTKEIEFIINYNMMNVVTHTFRQEIDKNRINTYEKEFKQYENDLKKYKEEHGL